MSSEQHASLSDHENLLASMMGSIEYEDCGGDNQQPQTEDDEEDDDPFDIDHYKLLHEPGVSSCQGRNILSILSDRSIFGPRYYHRHRGSNSNDIIASVRDDGDASSRIEENGDPQQQQQQFGPTSYHSPTPSGMPVTSTAAPPVSLLTSTPSPNNNLDNITAELISFLEYAAATKYRGSYLQHLRGDAPVRPLPPPNYPAGMLRMIQHHRHYRGAGIRMGVGIGNQMTASNNNNHHHHWNATTTMTREQLETQRQLQQHLQQHSNVADNRIIRYQEQQQQQQQQQPLLQGPMNPQAVQLRRIPGTNGVVNNLNINYVHVGALPNNFPARRIGAGVPPPARHHRPLNNNNNNILPNNNNDNNNNNNGTNAVSTISIDFSPNGRTLASTHGDHTVKITCAHTGKLLRELEGHPRTPWTVKYHPTNFRIVASGCLGCQVRVWDWNFQTEKVRRERRERVERKWGGRYHFFASNRSGGGGGSSSSRSGRELPSWDVGRGGYYTSSPRGVVDPYWKGGKGVNNGVGGGSRTNDDNRMDCTSTSSNITTSVVGSWELQYRQQQQQHANKATEASGSNSGGILTTVVADDGSRGIVEDDYAAYALTAMGIPTDDPAWYDTESEVYNCENGLGVCLHMIRLKHAIISLSFHPSGEILAIASGSTLHLWDYDEEKRKNRDALLRLQQQHLPLDGSSNATSQLSHSLATIKVRETDDRILDRHQNQNFPTSRTMDFTHDSALRCVHFPPGGDTIIIGGVNPQSYNEGLPNSRPRERGGMQGGGMSFHLRLWDFNLDAVLDPCTQHRPTAQGSGRGSSALGGRISDEGDLTWNFYVTKETLANPRILIPRVLLYNDGGFDLSNDGKVLSACAEYWLPDGVNSAMELIQSLREIEENSVNNNSKDSPTDDSRRGSVHLSPTRPKISGFPDPRTPPPNNSYSPPLEPPSPPGKRLPYMKRGVPVHNPHPLSIVAASHPLFQGGGGRYVPHIVTVSLDSSPPPDGELMQLDPKVLRTESMRKYPNLGQLLMAAPLDGTKASGVTCVKLSPSAEYCLLGYGVRENIPSVDGLHEARHPVTALYNVKNGMKHVSTLTSADDDVNIARFHPESGHGFVYGTKQGRVRVLAPRVWNHYHVDDE